MAKCYLSKRQLSQLNSLRMCAMLDYQMAKKKKDVELQDVLNKMMDDLYEIVVHDNPTDRCDEFKREGSYKLEEV